MVDGNGLVSRRLVPRQFESDHQPHYIWAINSAVRVLGLYPTVIFGIARFDSSMAYHIYKGSFELITQRDNDA